MHGLCEKNAAQWRAWNQRRQANREPACVHRVETIHVLGRINGRNDFLRVDLLRKRQLHQNSADLLIGVEFRDEIEQLRFTRARRKLVIKGAHARVRYSPGLGAHINFAGRVVANQHHGNAWHDAAVAPQAVNGVRDLAAQVGRNGFAVNDARAHVLSSYGAGAKRDGRDWPGHDNNFYPVLLNLSSAAASVGPSPEITSRLSRPDAPAARTISRGGTPNVFANNRIRAALASPSDGTARTRAISAVRPSGSDSIAPIASRALLGVSLIVSMTPSAFSDHGLRAMA